MFGHMLLVSVPLWAFTKGFVKLDLRILKKLLAVLVTLYILAHPVNLLFDFLLDQPANYFYTVRPEPGTPLEWFYEWGTPTTISGITLNPLYLLLTALLGFFVVTSPSISFQDAMRMNLVRKTDEGGNSGLINHDTAGGHLKGVHND